MSNVEQRSELQVIKNDHLHMMPIEQAQGWYNDFVAFSKSILKPELDFGIIPGTPKPSLYKPGAEKLRFVYGLGAEFDCIDKTVDLDRPFIDYSYRCTIKSKTGQILSQCEGSCNSLEPKFGYLWKQVNELPEGTDISRLPSKTTGKKLSEFDFAINKGETSGQYGKPQEYWDNWRQAIQSGRAKQVNKKSKSGKDLIAWELDETVTVYRIMNPDVIGVKNTIMKMAQKRAFVGAILLATGASEFFTQDIEDMEINGAVYSDHNNVPFTEAEVVPDPIAEQAKKRMEERIPGHWYAKLEKCKTVDDLLKLFNDKKETIEAWPELKQLFTDAKKQLQKNTVGMTTADARENHYDRS